MTPINKLNRLLIGVAIEIKNEAEARKILTLLFNGYPSAEDKVNEIIDKATRLFKGNYEYKHMSLSNLAGSILLNITFKTDEDDKEYDILDKEGAFGYVYNLQHPYLSELGYSYYIKTDDGLIVRQN